MPGDPNAARLRITGWSGQLSTPLGFTTRHAVHPMMKAARTAICGSQLYDVAEHTWVASGEDACPYCTLLTQT